MGTVNLPFWGYDATTFEPAARERFRPFIAIPFAPYFGIGGGGSVLLTRLLSLNVGYTELWYDTPGDGEAFDAVPLNKSQPFKSAHTGAWFVAAGVNFGRAQP
jgi:hypothetical protein